MNALPQQHAVIDTNVVLDLFLFEDPRWSSLRLELASGQVLWHATAHMREELSRVLGYPHIAAKLAFYAKEPHAVLADFDRYAQLAPVAPKAPYTCTDADDQVFIDLACELARTQAVRLYSKDKAVTSMRKRLTKMSVDVICQVEAVQTKPQLSGAV
jgi:predicted nucleic acid-binding protein